MTNRPKLAAGFLSGLRSILPPMAILTDPEDCWAYGYDNSRRHSLPQAVAFPTSHEQVVQIVNACNQHQTPLTARGRGTNTVGATVPLQGGLVVSLERMQKIIEFSPENRLLIVEPGLTNQEIQTLAGSRGFFWPPDPTSAAYCSLGGNLACNAAGPRAVKYGTPRENTLGLRAVTGAGREIRTGVRTSKGVVGYDLTRLLLGSEGTLAIITEATLKLTPLPEAVQTLRAIYRSVLDAAIAISTIMAQPIVPCALEFIDGNAIEMIRHHSACDLPAQAGALLMIEVDGPREGLKSIAAKVADAARNDGLLDIRIANTAQEVDALWQTRKALAPALRRAAPKKINEDVVVPVTAIPDLIEGLDRLSVKYDLPIINFGHAGNGNIHVNLLLNPDTPGQSQKAQNCMDEVFTMVLNLGGTLSGEHGVGLEKRDFIDRELDANVLELMRAIKRQFDPNGILNPGKLLPPD
ncbi:FAD-linked oxidase C-terminal domain-containing protein [Methylomicrobium sp. Wu6]|uniref:FAD-binding oxidoreductase n=1 Tax=Methylomicrobium sp. Wu6 TaxID=3107928 RepID=UPI002DD63821|nr:FAD-linked oxidase C-terminal domain-containing protein [Methylomicrobium sp. Wu6]MEC4748982.1 FAD-linked oxidase C-terminal domain-containing protein [Methylomicrobium sp. Wu6]